VAEIKVMMSAALKSAYLELVPRFETATGHRVTTLWVSTANIMSRLKSGDIVDLVIVHVALLDVLVDAGLIASKRRFALAKCGIGVAVRAGARKPDVSSGEALKRAVLDASSIVYSTGPSGVYLARLFERIGIAEAIAAKVKQVQGEPTGAVVARGEAELGFQQMSELLPVHGIDIVAPLSPDVQEITTFSAGVHVDAREPEAAVALVRYFQTPEAAVAIRASGMEPV
jgi:molybdate transport system substrate-binding protein